MTTRTLAATAAILLVNQLGLAQFAFADASFQSSTQITGGSLTDALKSVSFLKSTRDLLAPKVTTTMVHGNQKAIIDPYSTEIIDLDKETITRIDTVKKTYTVVTFAQLLHPPAAPSQPAAPAEKPQPTQPAPKSDVKMTFDVKVKNTGVSKVVNGLNAQEQVITMTMTATDPNAQPANGPTSATYTVTTDSWITPDPPEIKEVEDFDRRMAQKMAAGVDLSAIRSSNSGAGTNPGMAMMFANQPGAMDGMVQMGKEMSKLQGTHVLDVTSMGGAGWTPPGDGSAPPPPPDAAPGPSKSSMIGSALGKSALGRFGIKKNDPAPAAPADSTPGGGPPPAAMMMSMTTQKSNFSNASIPASAFEVPAGFKQVASPYAK